MNGVITGSNVVLDAVNNVTVYGCNVTVVGHNDLVIGNNVKVTGSTDAVESNTVTGSVTVRGSHDRAVGNTFNACPGLGIMGATPANPNFIVLGNSTVVANNSVNGSTFQVGKSQRFHTPSGWVTSSSDASSDDVEGNQVGANGISVFGARDVVKSNTASMSVFLWAASSMNVTGNRVTGNFSMFHPGNGSVHIRSSSNGVDSGNTASSDYVHNLMGLSISGNVAKMMRIQSSNYSTVAINNVSVNLLVAQVTMMNVTGNNVTTKASQNGGGPVGSMTINYSRNSTVVGNTVDEMDLFSVQNSTITYNDVTGARPFTPLLSLARF